MTADQLVVEDLTVRYGAVRAVKGLSLRVKAGELVTLLGPSGCGKTTTLRCIAGLEPCDTGTIYIAGRQVSGPLGEVPPEARKLNMVFQNYAIWPHMTVFENVAFGLKLLKLSRAEIKRRAEHALSVVGLAAFGQRYGTELSGGQQQRVAVARAIVTEPDLLLFDEPLSNLDAILREQMRVELREIHKRLGKASIYVTHDQTEAMALSDRIILMKDGLIVQEGPPRLLYESPRTRFAAEFLGFANLWDGKVSDSEAEHVVVELEAPGLSLLCRTTATKHATGSRGTFAIRAERIRIDRRSDFTESARNRLSGHIQRVTYLGGAYRYEVKAAGRSIYVETPPHFVFQPGEPVSIEISPDAAIWLADEDGPDGASSAMDC